MNPFLESIITKDFILSSLSQEQIFEKYLGISVEYNKLQRSGLRKDPKPSVAFKKMIGGDIICSDFGDARIKGDCFNLVAAIHRCEYKDTYKIIANDFNIIDTQITPQSIKKIYKSEILKDSKEKEVVPIQIKKREWSKQDIDFWRQYGISLKTLRKFNVFPISHYWYNDNIRTCRSMSFAYFFYTFCYKIYSPLEKVYRFINNSTRIQGYGQLPDKGELLIITKSLKDVMVLYEFGITSVSLQAEGNMLNQEYYDDLSSRFDKIISFYDYDYQGISGSGNLKRRYGIPRIMLSNGKYNTKDYGAKDISDYYLAFGKEKTQLLINKFKENEF